MKIAILLGVSEYASAANLPACRNDVDLLRSMIDGSGEYQDILQLTDNSSSSIAKQQIVTFLKQFRGKSLEQVLFYFTGHGDFDGKEFSYILSDYDAGRRKQTVIENSELDDWLRLVDAGLTVKIVDACHAGVQYIKDPEAFARFLSSAPKALKAYYFMFSSLKEQFSYQDRDLSFFTRYIAESIPAFTGTEIRFKDIIDYVSDAFQNRPNQTPLFVTQATNTEVFSPVDARLRGLIAQRIAAYHTTLPPIPMEPGTPQTPPTVLDFVRTAAAAYCAEDEALERLALVKSHWDQIPSAGLLADLYDVKVEILPSLSAAIPKLDAIGKWLAENQDEYFALPTSRTEQFTEEVLVPRRRVGIASLLAPGLLDEPETKTVTRNRPVITGYRLTQQTEFVGIRLVAKPKFENLGWYDCHIGFVFSKTEIRFFYLFSLLRQLNWQERERCPLQDWRMTTADLKTTDHVREALIRITDEFSHFVLSPVQVKYESSTKADPRTQPPEQRPIPAAPRADRTPTPPEPQGPHRKARVPAPQHPAKCGGSAEALSNLDSFPDGGTQ